MNARTTSAANGLAAATFTASIFDEPLPPPVMLQAKKCLVDWCAVSLGAHAEEAARLLRRVTEAWRSQGDAVVLLGGKTAPVVAAMINGTLAHCLDFDDTHGPSVGHFSGPTWAAVLALGTARRARETDLLTAFTAGFEVGPAWEERTSASSATRTAGIRPASSAVSPPPPLQARSCTCLPKRCSTPWERRRRRRAG